MAMDPQVSLRDRSLYAAHLKRPLDVLGSVVLLAVFLPVMVLAALAVLVMDRHSFLFRQVRPGFQARPFRVIKFRTMREARDSQGRQLHDKDRLTSLGHLLRKTSLDELPQLFNVLAGSMSLVGPRPLLTRYLPHYRADELKRFELRPGMTGLAQVRGRNLLSWDDRLALDVRYHDEVSFWLDARILLETCRVVFLAKGLEVLPNLERSDLDTERSAEVVGTSARRGESR
jgi:lipopolysaccharide/colanic/teichoic acid biosynthesis glycosyltransferase